MKTLVVLVLLLTLSCSQEQEDIVYEEEQLDPLPPPPPEPTPPIETPPPPPTQSPRSSFKFDMATLKSYQHEVLLLLGIFLYLLNYLRGKKANVRLMERFYRKVAHCL